jgi:hypothetical protein
MSKEKIEHISWLQPVFSHTPRLIQQFLLPRPALIQFTIHNSQGSKTPYAVSQIHWSHIQPTAISLQTISVHYR